MPRFRRFSLRALLLLVTCIAIAFGYIGRQRYLVSRQASAIKQIEALGGVTLPINLRDEVPYNISGKLPEPQYNRWMYWVFGVDYFTYVPLIKLHSTTSADSIRAMVPYISQLRLKEGLNEAGKTYIAIDVGGNPNIDKHLIDYIETNAPCKVLASDPNSKGPYQ
jgi:hypothetical protein